MPPRIAAGHERRPHRPAADLCRRFNAAPNAFFKQPLQRRKLTALDQRSYQLRLGSIDSDREHPMRNQGSSSCGLIHLRSAEERTHASTAAMVCRLSRPLQSGCSP